MGQSVHCALAWEASMALMRWLLEHHQFLMHQCFSLPFAFLFYSLARRGYLSLTSRYGELLYRSSLLTFSWGRLLSWSLNGNLLSCIAVSVSRYLCVSVGGCVLAVATMGGYSLQLLVPTVAFPLLVHQVDHSNVHIWAFGLQMLWQTSWHLLLQYKEYYLQEPVCIRYSMMEPCRWE